MLRRTLIAIAVLSLGLWAATPAVSTPQNRLKAKTESATTAATDAITIPHLLSYQGKLLDASGNPVPDTTYSISFRLYAVASGGSSFWNEDQTMRTKSGLFSALLGSVTPIGAVPDAGTLYLGMKVGADPEMTPRIQIASAAYSFLAGQAADADLLQGKDTTAFARTGHSHAFVDSSRVAVVAYDSRLLQGKDTTALDSRYVNEGQGNAVSTAMIRDTNVTMPKLARTGATTGQVVKWNGSAWAPGPDDTGGASDSARIAANSYKLEGKDTTALDARYVNEGQTAGGGLTGTYPSPTMGSNAVGSANITDGSITSADIRDTTFPTAKLKDGSVTAPKLNEMSASSGQVLKWTGSAWAPKNDSIGGTPSGAAGGDLSGTYP